MRRSRKTLQMTIWMYNFNMLLKKKNLSQSAYHMQKFVNDKLLAIDTDFTFSWGTPPTLPWSSYQDFPHQIQGHSPLCLGWKTESPLGASVSVFLLCPYSSRMPWMALIFKICTIDSLLGTYDLGNFTKNGWCDSKMSDVDLGVIFPVRGWMRKCSSSTSQIKSRMRSRCCYWEGPGGGKGAKESLVVLMW